MDDPRDPETIPDEEVVQRMAALWVSLEGNVAGFQLCRDRIETAIKAELDRLHGYKLPEWED